MDCPRHIRPVLNPLRAQNGNALVIVFLLIAVILTLAAYGSRSSQIELRIAHNNMLSQQALNAAEAGINHARSVIQKDGGQFNNYLTNGGTAGALAGIGAVVTLEDGVNYRFRSFGGPGTKDGYYVRVVDNHDELSGSDDVMTDSDKAIDIISRGRVGGAERLIRARVRAPAPCVLGWPTPAYTNCPLGPTRGPMPFAENGTLKAIRPVGFALSGTSSIDLFYGDEHAMTLGAQKFDGTVCPVEPTPAAPACRNNPQVGCKNATDDSGRPLWPALFITDITNDPASRAGDWQCGGNAQSPSAVCGLWKPFIPGSNVQDPATANGSTLGAGADAYPSLPDSTCDCTDSSGCSCSAENYGAEVRWDIATLTDETGNALASGHVYRAQVMVHDGDQNQDGGDVGQSCVNFIAP